MIDNTRRSIMKYMALLGFGTIAGAAVPVRVRATLKDRKAAFDARQNRQHNGYYGFSETWA